MSSSEAPPTPTDAARRRARRVLLVVFVTMFLDLVGFGIIIPIQPFFAEAFGATPTLVTWLGAIYSLMQFIFAPFWGRLSDRFGRRPIVLCSIALGGVGYLLFGLANSLIFLFAARALAGFGNANIGTVQAIVADVTTSEDRTKGMGIIGAAFGLGFILGPALGGAFGQLGLAAPAFAAAATVEHGQLAAEALQHDLRAVAVLAVLVGPLPGLKLALDIDLGALAQVLLGDLRQALVEDHHAVPLGALAPLAGIAVAPGLRGR